MIRTLTIADINTLRQKGLARKRPQGPLFDLNGKIMARKAVLDIPAHPAFGRLLAEVAESASEKKLIPVARKFDIATGVFGTMILVDAKQLSSDEAHDRLVSIGSVPTGTRSGVRYALCEVLLRRQFEYATRRVAFDLLDQSNLLKVEEAVPFLLALGRDDPLYARKLRALGDIHYRTPELLMDVIKRISRFVMHAPIIDRDDDPRLSDGVVVLGKIGDQTAIAALCAVLTHHAPSDKTKTNAANAIASIAYKMGDEGIIIDDLTVLDVLDSCVLPREHPNGSQPLFDTRFALISAIGRIGFVIPIEIRSKAIDLLKLIASLTESIHADLRQHAEGEYKKLQQT